VGTRPEAIKLGPVIIALRAKPSDFAVRLITSGQHREICYSALAAFGLIADEDLAVEVGSLLAHSAADVLRIFAAHLLHNRPDILLVQGDTTTAMAAALAAFYGQVPVAHVEAGLRSNDLANPFPEEANRTIIDAISTILLPPTPLAQRNLLRAGFQSERCPIVGNTVVDALQLLCAAHPPTLAGTGIEEMDLRARRLILVTTHRRESWGFDLETICTAIRTIANNRPDVVVVLPVHPNPNVKAIVTDRLGGHPRIKLVPPLGYLQFLSLMRRAFLILTDSGGIQEEAPSLGVPLLVLRKITERPEAAQAGLARVIGTNTAAILDHAFELLDKQDVYRRMATAGNPYGDGRASERIVEILRNWKAGRALLAKERSFQPRIEGLEENALESKCVTRPTGQPHGSDQDN